MFAARGTGPAGAGAGFTWLAAGGWAVFFTATGAVSLIHSLTSDTIRPDGKLGGIIVGVTFLLMGVPGSGFVAWPQLRSAGERSAFAGEPMGGRRNGGTRRGGRVADAVARSAEVATAQRRRTPFAPKSRLGISSSGCSVCAMRGSARATPSSLSRRRRASSAAEARSVRSRDHVRSEASSLRPLSVVLDVDGLVLAGRCRPGRGRGPTCGSGELAQVLLEDRVLEDDRALVERVVDALLCSMPLM